MRSPCGLHQALLFRQLSARVTLLRHSGPALTGEQREQLDARGITVTEGPVEEIEADASGLTGARLADGRQIKLDAVIVAPRMHARAELLAPLGLEPAELRHSDYLIGVWVAGNLANLQAQVITAAAAGLAAGAAINYDLVLEETAQAAEKRHATDSNHAVDSRPATAGRVD